MIERQPLSRMIKTLILLACLQQALFLAVPLAAQAPQVKVLNTVKIAQCHYFGYFPSLHLLSTGELIVSFMLNADAHSIENNFWGFVVSRDKGKTWGMRNTAGMVYSDEAAYTRIPRPDGCLAMIAGYFLPAGGTDYRNLEGVSVHICDHANNVIFRRDVHIELPQPSQRIELDQKVENFASLGPGKIKESGYVFFSGSLIKSRNGGLLTTLYGKFEGDHYYRTFVAKSDQKGKDWKYVSTIAGDESAVILHGESKTEGFTEPRMIRLRDGRLFVLMRRGSNNQMFKSWSSDDGKTWSKPVSIGFQGVKPALWLMKSGILALSTGRPGPVRVYFSQDGGTTWSSPTVIYSGRGLRYTDLAEIAPHKLLVVYDHVPFDWGVIPDSEPKAMNEIYGTFVEVK
jgi:BNR repeat-like domain